MQPDTAVAPTPTQTLMAISSTICSLWDFLESAETEDDKAVAIAELERVVSTDLAAKADGIAWFDRSADSEIELLKAMRDDIQKRIVAWQTRKERIREMTRFAMQRMGATRIQGKVHTISVRPGAESVEITNSLELPPQYVKLVQTFNPDKAQIKAALKAGMEVRGARLTRGEDTICIR